MHVSIPFPKIPRVDVLTVVCFLPSGVGGVTSLLHLVAYRLDP